MVIRTIIFLLIGIISKTAYCQKEDGYIKTTPYQEISLMFDFDDGGLIMRINVNGGILSYGDEVGFRIKGIDTLSSFEYLNRDTTFNLMTNILVIGIDSSYYDILAANGVGFFYVQDYPFEFSKNDSEKTAKSAQQTIKGGKPKWVKLNPITYVYFKFEIDVFNEPVMMIDLDGGVLTDGDTIGFNVNGAEFEVYYAYDDEYKIDLNEEPFLDKAYH